MDWLRYRLRVTDEALAAGRLVILEIDVQGALQVKQSLPGAFMLFILPPREEDLLDRLRRRGRDDERAIQRRYDEARAEIAKARESDAYDAFIVNDDLERAQDEACALIEAEMGARVEGGTGRSENA